MESREFKVGELFRISGSPSVNKEKIGDGSKKLTPYICRGKVDSGYSGSFFHTPSQKANCIIVGSQGATAFYQHKDFFTGTGVLIIRHDKMTENIGLYVSTALNNSLFLHGGRSYEVSQGSLNSLEVSLPSIIHEDDTSEPDWDYMENYIKNLRDKIDAHIKSDKDVIENIKKHGNEKIDVSEWKEFRTTEIFENVILKKIKKPEFISSTKTKKYIFPVLNQSSVNNQVEGYLEEFSTNGNLITIDNLSSGFAFYQSENFSSINGRHNFAIKILSNLNKDLNENLSLFLVSILNKNLSQKGYSDQRGQKKFFLETIKLPVDPEGNPDWDYMENYIKNLKNK